MGPRKKKKKNKTRTVLSRNVEFRGDNKNSYRKGKLVEVDMGSKKKGIQLQKKGGEKSKKYKEAPKLLSGDWKI